MLDPISKTRQLPPTTKMYLEMIQLSILTVLIARTEMLAILQQHRTAAEQ